jgi:hypothetical protein
MGSIHGKKTRGLKSRATVPLTKQAGKYWQPWPGGEGGCGGLRT